MSDETFGEKIRRLRVQKGLSIRAAAKLLGIGHTRLTEIEKGVAYRTGSPTGPSRDLIERTAKLFGEPKDSLLELAGFKANRPELSLKEAELVDLFREIGEPGQAMVLDLIRAVRPYVHQG